ncbi:unnamed protein product [Protopolystoma xenopodis]|uniref:Uncharacterized protein n=1 Tax=Protopolystoma xenopodis TaxID=117903 RepID=A0A448XBU0_9PLAT|nr:unnamed protein product [Protopolystoma xenopodis]
MQDAIHLLSNAVGQALVELEFKAPTLEESEKEDYLSRKPSSSVPSSLSEDDAKGSFKAGVSNPILERGRLDRKDYVLILNRAANQTAEYARQASFLTTVESQSSSKGQKSNDRSRQRQRDSMPTQSSDHRQGENGHYCFIFIHKNDAEKNFGIVFLALIFEDS